MFQFYAKHKVMARLLRPAGRALRPQKLKDRSNSLRIQKFDIKGKEIAIKIHCNKPCPFSEQFCAE